jgi:hypothetical protein
MRKAVLILFFQFVFNIGTLLAQKQVDRQSLYWLRYYNTLNFTPKWNWQTELDTRYFFANNRKHQFIAHTRIAYKPNVNWYFSSGLTGSWQKPQDPYAYPRPVTPELRLVQEASVNQPLLKAFSANYRIRVEERFVSNHPGRFDEDFRFAFRHRYRWQLTYLLKAQNLTIRISDEVFVNALQENLFGKFDQNRFYVAIEKRVSPALSFELGYMNINQPIKGKNLVIKRDNLRFTMYHTLYFR